MSVRISKTRLTLEAVPINLARATVASHATTADIWAAAGNQIDWTGTATTTAFPNAPQAGAERVLICAGACSFTASANMLIDGVASAATVTCAANDQIIVRAISTTQFKLSRIKYDGTAQVGGGGGFTSNVIDSTPVSITAGQCASYIHYVTNAGATVLNLPAVSGVTDGSHVVFFMKTAYVLTVNPDDTNRIVLNGVALDNGDKIISDGTVGNYVTLHKDSALGWTVLGRSGYWADGGI